MPLSEQEIETYRHDGLVIPAGYRLPDASLQRIHDLYDELLLGPTYATSKVLSFEGNHIYRFPPTIIDFARKQLQVFHIGRYNFLSGKEAVAYLELFNHYHLKSAYHHQHS